ncbi:MAG: tRNA (adenosine(37)-N6)-dimethylallyltransferase MiaA [Verrucomicrobiales bacterium]
MAEKMQFDGVLALAGPTASGKSAVAAALARACDAEVVNLDPYQAFAGMKILTAQPSETELAMAPHHLYGFLETNMERDAAGFAALAHSVVAEICQRGKKVILVSGSGLYLRAFSGGLDSGLPAPDAELRARLEAMSLESQLDELQRLDPEEWERIDRMNPRRVTRALEICLLSGQPASSLRRGQGSRRDGPPSFSLWPETESLKTRIRERSARMFGPELSREIDALEKLPLGRSASTTLGLATARAWRAGTLEHTQAAEELATLTWQYARRQRTWFKKAEEFQRVETGDLESPEDLASRIRLMAGW